jgi:hypothetical protein
MERAIQSNELTRIVLDRRGVAPVIAVEGRVCSAGILKGGTQDVGSVLIEKAGAGAP